MGERKRKLKRNQRLLEAHPVCVFCGAAATTIDHCPPRAFFEERQWPETYEFPACEQCNNSTRLDEQALAVLIRCRLSPEERSPKNQIEWKKLLDGVQNNQPKIIEEWKGVSRNEIKKELRRAFGAEGDMRRTLGWGAINVGPLTQAAIENFMVKLGKALYFKHNGHVFDGAIYIYKIDRFSKYERSNLMEIISRLAPGLPEIKRNGKSLFQQFIYHLNHNSEQRVLYAAVQFGDQLIFQLFALGREIDARVQEENPNWDLSQLGRHECFLFSSDVVK